MQSGGAAPSISLSPPSFNAYSSSDTLAQIAARVVSELRDELDQADLDDIDDVYHQNDDDVTDLNGDEDEFEFACVSRDAAPTIAAEEAFYDGQIRPVYPVFDQSLLLPNEDDDVADVDKHSDEKIAAPETRPRRRQLGILMSEKERGGGETASCSSSLEADDLESLPAGTYCVWAPGKAAESRSNYSEKGGKIGSGGASSRRWRFRDLLYRSNSEGSTKGILVFLAAKKVEEKEKEKEGGNVVVVRKVGSEAADGDKRRSFLPYKQDVVGFFSNVNGLGRNLHPF